MNQHILYIDEPVIALIARELFSHKGYDVTTIAVESTDPTLVEQIEASTKEVKPSSVDLVLMDSLMLPEGLAYWREHVDHVVLGSKEHVHADLGEIEQRIITTYQPGLAVLKFLKGRRFSNMHVLFERIGYVLPQLVAQFKSAGAQEVLDRPLDLLDVVNKVVPPLLKGPLDEVYRRKYVLGSLTRGYAQMTVLDILTKAK